MILYYSKRIFCAMALWCSSQLLFAETTISVAEWLQPHSTSSIIELADMRRMVTILLQQPDTRLQITYAGGDEGEIWARQLHDWLVALGIASDRIALQQGFVAAESAFIVQIVH